MTTFLLLVCAFFLVDQAWKQRDSRRRLVGFAATATIAAVAAVAVLPNLLYIGKVAGRLLMPVGLIWLSLAAVAGYHWVRRNSKKGPALGVFIAFTIAGNVPLGGAMLASLESDYVERDRFSGPPLDVVFVLGGSTARSPLSGQARLAESGDRLLTAARVFKTREVGTLVTSGSSIPGLGQTRDVAAEAAEILVGMGVPAGRILQIPDPKNSSQEILAYRSLARERRWQRMGLITSAWHLRRVERLAAAAGLDAEPIPADFRGGGGWDGLMSVIPDAGGFRNMQRACWEYLGAAVGR